MEQTKNNDEIEIDLIQIINMFIKKSWIIIIGFIVGAIIAFSYTQTFVEPMYSADIKLYVNSGGISVGSVSISSSDLTLSRSLIDTYTTILKTRTTLNEVISQGDLEYTTDELSSMISARSLNDTEIFQISITSTDPYEAEHIANVIAIVLPDQIADIIMDSTISVLDYAITPAEPVSPSVTTNTVVGALVGAIIVCGVLLIMYLTKQQITSIDELAAISDAPILTVIPDFDDENSKKSKKQKRKKTKRGWVND